LPVGMQLMGPHFGEERLFETVHAYQQVSDWHLRKPDLGVVL
jgi:aspartyl-tRNA(Asn)/glutamyl-tRNA(Gln) amidotransferase subunit A